ncbi:dihydrolipoamide acetyltransferase family protein [Anaeroselena agilis]|uniref:Dihydrolipoamide acetyltransferase component of pyruvate dehydrogenase complex n=1 Tax=Anaeroselena agilis TaxID=3063788 RepID=A0ABU3NZD9_9FIRM|nr:dihydrolipoamide acetyltransferase family protein [Selenomonadales bacterium 4137-cl]
MATNFSMPQLGLTMTEGTVSKWFKQVGEKVAAGEILAEISTDKITNQIEAPADGVLLAVLVPEGGVAPVQAVLAVIGEPGEKIDAAEAEVAAAAPAPAAQAQAPAAPAPAARAAAGDGRVIASPLAKKLAQEKGIDLALVTGTGPNGRVVEKDILAYAARQAAAPKASPLAAKIAAEHGVDLAAIAKDSRIMAADVRAAMPAQAPAAAVPLTGMRKVISDRMALSWQTTPHVHNTVEIDMTEATNLKDKLAQQGSKFSFTELIVKCSAKALAEFPMVNNSYVDGSLVVNKAINIGIAVALEDGLIVPVVRNADQKTLAQLRADIGELAAKARGGKLLPDDYTGGTFTVTNLGMYGVDHFTPIINPPESAILGVCRTVPRPVVVDGAIVIRPMMNLCLGYNHRIIDGALAGKFLARVRELLEQPMLLL